MTHLSIYLLISFFSLEEKEGTKFWVSSLFALFRSSNPEQSAPFSIGIS